VIRTYDSLFQNNPRYTSLIDHSRLPLPNPIAEPSTGELIIKLAPQIVINTSATDLIGQPLVMETYNFSVKDVFEAVTIEEYLM
jgi:hypothetical protein